MAKISLREYVREIESQIDHGDTQKAIAHCKHLLRYYPKHIDTYRLFGKSLLEMQKYGDASDIFQRVLSSVPDDFIAQIGMSIIKEDENNLDAAIWHLERAFEIQPSNKAVQDELKRLYSSRDGVVPTKIRLTRGALVRMYARGDLYAQAIAEIKAALIEDPNRVDLEVILARLYFMVGQKVDATETASRLITKLPYCYEANRILAEILPGTSRHNDAMIFRQRVIDLDPYFEFVNESIPNPIDIDDGKIMVEMLDWDPSMAESDQPDWAKSIGLDWDSAEKPADPALDSWLSNELDLSRSEKEDEPTFQFENTSEMEENNELTPTDEYKADEDTNDQSEDLTVISLRSSPESDVIKVNPEENIPAWLSEVGWAVSDESNPELEKGFNIPEEDDESVPEIPKLRDESEIEPGIIPDWVQKLAPRDVLRSEGIIDSDDQLIGDRNFEKLFPTSKQEIEEESFFKDLGATQTWMNEFTNEQESFSLNEEERDTQEQISLSSGAESTPINIENSITDFEDEEPAFMTDSMGEVADIDEATSEKTDGLNEKEYIEIEEPISKPSDTSWFKDLLPSDGADLAENEIEEEIEDRSFLSFLPDIGDSEVEEQIVPEPVEENDFSWLNALQSSVGEEEETESETNAEDVEPLDSELDRAAEFDLSRFMESQKQLDEPLESSAAIPDFTLEDKTPEWVESLMSSLPEETADELKSKVESSPLPESKAEIEDTASEEIESAFAWMEGLTSKHSSPEETLVSEPEISSTTPPEWIKDFQEEPVEEAPDPFMEASRKSNADFLEEDLTPSWLKALQDEVTDVEEPSDQDLSELTEFADLDQENVKELQLTEEIEQELEATNFIETETIQSENEIVEQIQEKLEEKPEGLVTRDEMMETPQELQLSETEIIDLIETPLSGEEPEDDQRVPTELEDTFTYIGQEVETIDLPENPLSGEEIEDDTSTSTEREDTSISSEKEAEIPAWLSGYDADIVSEESLEQSSAETRKWQPAEIFDEFVNPEEISETVAATTSEMYSSVLDTLSEPEESPELPAVETSPDVDKAWQELQKGHIPEAVALYDQLIQSKTALTDVIQHLQESLDHYYPIDISLWLTLGDAYLRSNQLQNALDAYTKAEELIS